MNHMEEKIKQMRQARILRCNFPFEVKELYRGYADRFLRIDLNKNEISIHPVSQQMKNLWTGGKGFDLWLMFHEVDKNTKWDSPNNPICFSPGPLGGTTSFPGSGKTLVTSLSPVTHSVMDCNVGGFFGPFLKFAGFDALVIIGKAQDETVILIDAVNKRVTIETAPMESIDSHILAEELTEMYASDDIDKRNIAVVSAGRAAQYSRLGVLNFSFWDWRRNVARLKQAGRGGIGTVFRDKKLKALVIKSRDITPAWRVEENPAAKDIKPKKIITQDKNAISIIDHIIEKWGNDREYVTEMMQDIQEQFHFISRTALDRLTFKTGVPTAYLYHIATFDPFFSLEEHPGQTPDPLSFPIPHPLPFSVNPPSLVLQGKNNKDCLDIQSYTANGGYETWKRIVTNQNQDDVLREFRASGLQDRNSGESFIKKLEIAVNASQERNENICLVCRSGAAHPLALAGNAILETNPHVVIEGMLITAFGVGAKEGYIIINREHKHIEEGLNRALSAAKEKKFLGNAILGTGFSFNISLHRLDGSVVCGESTALLTAMSGQAGESQPRYIPVEEKGLHGHPTLIFHVETFANIPVIMAKGAAWFATIGTESTPGTKIFFLTGDVVRPALVEVTFGSTIREIIETMGGGVKGKMIKAVQVGGPAGGCLPFDCLDTPIDFQSLALVGAPLGAGILNVMNEKTCLVDKAREFVDFLLQQSCGKCTPCREGLFALKNIMKRIVSGQGTQDDIALLDEVSQTIITTSLCSFGSHAPTSLMSLLRYFKPEFEEHVSKKTCPLSVCKANA